MDIKASRISNSFLTVDISYDVQRKSCKLGIAVDNGAIAFILESAYHLTQEYDDCSLEYYVEDFVYYANNEKFEAETCNEKSFCWLDGNLTPFSSSTVFAGELEYSFERINSVGAIEKDLILFDMRFNCRITALTFIISSALALVRTSLDWEEIWET